MISERLRKIENLHIIFWLTKDLCWCLLSKDVAIAMIYPTIAIALWVVIKTRKIMSEFAHNLAVLFWISANSIWMYGELTCEDCTRPQALLFFAAGMLTLAAYYGLLLYRRLIGRKADSGVQ
jgi:hypothetical protein